MVKTKNRGSTLLQRDPNCVPNDSIDCGIKVPELFDSFVDSCLVGEGGFALRPETSRTLVLVLSPGLLGVVLFPI